jgi:hypothetical protein
MWSLDVNKTFSERYSYTHQAFTRAPHWDFVYLHDMIVSQKLSVAEHLFDLQSDPNYMWRYLKELRDASHLRWVPSKFMGRVLVPRFRNLYRTWMDWQELEEELANVLNTVYVWQGASVQPGRALPRDLDRALGALEIACINAVRRTAKVLGELSGYLMGVDDTAMEVEVKKLVKRLEQGATGAQRIVTYKARRPVVWMQEDPLDWCIHELAKSPDDTTGFDHAMLFKFLEEHLTLGEKNRLEPAMMRQLLDLAALHELLMAVRMHRPRNTNQTIEAFTGTKDRTMWNLLQTKGNLSDQQHAMKRIEAATQTLYDSFC